MIKFVLKKNKTIEKDEYKTNKIDSDNKPILDKNGNVKTELTENKKLELKFDAKTDVVPKKTNRLLCCIFTSDKKCSMVWRKFRINPKSDEIDFFRFKKGMYIIDAGGIHITSNGVRIALYFEGISTPLKITDIETEVKTVKYTDLQGNIQKSIIHKIKHLKVDAKILEVFFSRRFSEIFTRDRGQFQLGKQLKLLCWIIIIIGIINVGGVILAKIL